MKRLLILLFVVTVNLSSCSINQEREITQKSGSSTHQPEPLDDEWSKWLVGEWKVVSGESSIADESGKVSKIDLDEQEMIKAYDDADRKFFLRQLAFATTGGIWAINILHAMISGPRAESSLEMPHTELANWNIRAQITQYSASILACHRF